MRKQYRSDYYDKYSLRSFNCQVYNALRTNSQFPIDISAIYCKFIDQRSYD